MNHSPIGLRTCIYRVPDLATAKEFYAQAFGTTPYFDEPYYVGFNIGGYELGLQPEESATDRVRGTNIITYWGVENIENSYSHFIHCGATAHGAPANVGGPIMVATVCDPWQNLIGLIYNPTFTLPDSQKD